MKKIYWVVISVMVACSYPIAYTSLGYAFVTPEHYEKIKKQTREKDKSQEKPTRDVPPGKLQVHQPGEGQAPLRKSNPK
jgi:hypothetical protein